MFPGRMQALQVRDQWRDGRVEFVPGGSIKVWPQFLNPNPAVIADVRFRRALFHAIDRQQMADTLVAGLAPVAHMTITPTEPAFKEVEAGAIRYEYDPGRAVQMIEGLGYSRGADGIFRDAANQRLTVEVRMPVVDILQKSMLAVADNWQRIGVNAETSITPIQRQADNEYNATFPGFDTNRASAGMENLKIFHSSEVRLPEKRYVGRNSANYASPDLDALIDRYLRTIPWAERMEVTRQIVRHLTDQVVVMDLYYDASPTLVGSRIQNVHAMPARGSTTTWNVHEWDVR